MGLAKSKFKKSQDFSSDPFESLDDHVHELIVQHFSGADILNAFKVSNAWNRRFSDSRTGMGKIMLVFYDNSVDKHQKLKLRKLLHSQRKYQNLKCELTSADFIAEKMLILTHYSLSLVELDISTSGYDEQLSALLSKCLTNLSLPKLKTLEISELWPAESAIILMKAATNVNKLSLTTHRSLGVEFFDCLMKMKHLKELVVYAVDFFRSLVHSPTFTLTKLVVKTYSAMHKMQNDQTIFESFMLKMKDSLTFLEFESCQTNDINLIINKLKALNTLIIRDIRGNRTELMLEPNYSIIEFRWNGFDEKNYWPLKDVVGPLINLEILDVKCLEMNKFRWMLKTKERLKIVKFNTWNYSDATYDHAPNALYRVTPKEVLNLYQHLKLSDQSINQNITFVFRNDRLRLL